MLQTSDLHTLNDWCRHRGLRWAPAASAEPAMLLEQSSASHPWHRMVLQVNKGGLRLHDEAGTLLAEASNLPALLDAVDGGVAEPQSWHVFGRIAAAAVCTGLAAHVVL